MSLCLFLRYTWTIGFKLGFLLKKQGMMILTLPPSISSKEKFTRLNPKLKSWTVMFMIPTTKSFFFGLCFLYDFHGSFCPLSLSLSPCKTSWSKVKQKTPQSRHCVIYKVFRGHSFIHSINWAICLPINFELFDLSKVCLKNLYPWGPLSELPHNWLQDHVFIPY